MTEKALPSTNRSIEAFKTAGAIAYGGHTSEGFVIDGASPTELSIQDSEISHTSLNTFAETSSASSFDVTIDPGEGFVFGSWVAIDTGTTVTLAASTAGQTVYVGWNKDGSDDLIVGLSSAFDNVTGNTDEKIALWDFDTDGSGVTAVTDRRSIGYTQQATSYEGDITLNSNNILEFGAIQSDDGLNISGNNDAMWIAPPDGAGGPDFNSELRFDTDTWGVEVPFNLINSSAIQDAGTDAITFDGTQNVTIPNGNLGLGNNNISNVNNIGKNDARNGISFTDPTDGTLAILESSDATTGPRLDISSLDKFALPQVSADPSASAGDMWYRSDLD